MRKESEIEFGRRAFLQTSLLVAEVAALSACNIPGRAVTPDPYEGKAGNFNFPKGEQESPATEGISESSPEPLPNPSQEPTEAPFTYFDKYVYPALFEIAQKRRLEKASLDSDYWNRVDSELNEDRVNFVLLGLGSEGLLTDSNHMMSLKKGENEIRSVTIHRDTEAPEVSRFKKDNNAYRINQAHFIGGMPLVEQVLEDATGLAADYIVVLDMNVLPRAVEDVFGNRLEVCIPWEIDDVMMGYFPQGLQKLDGEEVLSVSRARYYGSNENRNIVQQYVLRAIVRRAKAELSGNLISAADFIRRGYLFYDKETEAGNILTNFDKALFLDIAKNLASQLINGGEEGKAQGFGLPYFSGRHHVRFESAGDSADRYRKKPQGGDAAAADLVARYWFSARQEVKDFLLSSQVGGFEQEVEICGVEE